MNNKLIIGVNKIISSTPRIASSKVINSFDKVQCIYEYLRYYESLVMRPARFAILEEPQIGTPETTEAMNARLFIKNEYIHIVKSRCGLNGRWNVAHNGRWKNVHADARQCSYPGKTAARGMLSEKQEI